MKQLTCEMCGGIDLIKQDGAYVCQNCGMKYSVEEAKKMMIEGTVEVQGTVKVDNSAFVEKYLINARRAKQKEDWAETEKYYNMVEQNDPTNIEAIFYSAYGKAKTSLVERDLYKRQAAFKVLQNCVSIIDDNFDVEKENENRKIVEEISHDIIDMACSSYVYNQSKNGYGITIKSDRTETITLFNNLSAEFMTTLENIANKVPENQKKNREFYYRLALKHGEFVIANGELANSQGFKGAIMSYHRRIKELNPDHYVPEQREYASKQSRSSGKVFNVLMCIYCLAPLFGAFMSGMCLLGYNKGQEAYSQINPDIAKTTIFFNIIISVIVFLVFAGQM